MNIDAQSLHGDMRVVVVLGLCIAVAVVGCQPADARGGTTAAMTGPAVGSSPSSSPSPSLSPVSPLHSLVLPPRAPSPGLPPALVLVHGLGSNERDLAGLASRLDPRFVVHSLRAPIPMGRDAYGWFKVTFTPDGIIHDVEGATAARATLVGELRALKASGTVDPERVFVLGFSQGAILGLATALTEPGLVSGVVAVAGRTLPEVQRAAAGKALTGTAVLLVHGRDDQKLPFALGEKSRDIVQASGLPLTWRPHDGGHTITPAMLQDIDAWLRAQLTG